MAIAVIGFSTVIGAGWLFYPGHQWPWLIVVLVICCWSFWEAVKPSRRKR